MRVIALKSNIILSSSDLVEEIIASMGDRVVLPNSIIAISSKVVAITEGMVVPKNGTDKEKLILDQADLYLDPSKSKYGHHFTIKHNTLIGSAGIDSSNGDDNYVLWPKNPQQSANSLRKTLAKYYKCNLGVIITDSTSTPLRRGTVGSAIAHSGFNALSSYIGENDIFGQKIQHSVLNKAMGFAAAANVVMGEGNEQTPFVLIENIENLVCTDKNPDQSEIDSVYPKISEDLFEPFLSCLEWQKKEETNE